MQPDESDPDQLLITAASEESRGPDSLGPSRSLPARPPAKGGPLGLIAGVVATLAALALFALPSRTTHSASTLIEQTLDQLKRDGLALRSVRCPHELELRVGRSFSCSAQAEGVALRIVLTPIASRELGPIDILNARVDGTVGVADVARAAALRYDSHARVTCPHLRWVDKPDARERCTLQVGQDEGPLTVLARTPDGELALEADWIAAR